MTKISQIFISNKTNQHHLLDLSKAKNVDFFVHLKENEESAMFKIKNSKEKVLVYKIKNGQKISLKEKNFFPGIYKFLSDKVCKIEIVYNTLLQTPIFNTDLPFVVKTSGYYYLAENLNFNNTDYAITVKDIDNFILDGRNFNIGSSGVKVVNGNNIDIKNLNFVGSEIENSSLFCKTVNNLNLNFLKLKTGSLSLEYCKNITIDNLKANQNNINTLSSINFYNCENVFSNNIQTKNYGISSTGVYNGSYKNIQILTNISAIEGKNSAFVLFPRTKEEDLQNTNIVIENLQITNNSLQTEDFIFQSEISFVVYDVSGLKINNLNILRNIENIKRNISLVSFYILLNVKSSIKNVIFENSSVILNYPGKFETSKLINGIDFYDSFADFSFNKIFINNVKVTGFESNIIFDGNNGSDIIITNCETNKGNYGYAFNNQKNILCKNNIAKNSTIGFSDSWYFSNEPSFNVAFIENIALSCATSYQIKNNNNISENNKSYFENQETLEKKIE